MAQYMPAFFSFYGAKHSLAREYPAPRYDVIVEPFAGSAGYACQHYAHAVILCDADPVICAVWKYLIGTPADEIRELPLEFAHVDELTNISKAARWLIGLWINIGNVKPLQKRSQWARSKLHESSFWGAHVRERIACWVDEIRHWRVVHCAWDKLDAVLGNIEATWFVDPPYQGRVGNKYVQQVTDYAALGAWTRERRGQVIACEAEEGAWLPFRAFALRSARQQSVRDFGIAMECVWTK